MDFNFSPCGLQEVKCHLKQERSMDAGYFSAPGSLSPCSSIDSGCFSPPVSCRHLEEVGKTTTDETKPRIALQVEGRKRSRSKNPGMKRQTASEREKLRMRDLTKAIHHLQNFLPPSVVSPGQTLTKIETLRLTIGYISYLSAQLEQPETSSVQMESLQPGPISENWCLGGQQGHFQDTVQYCPSFVTQQMENNFPSISNYRNEQSYMFPSTTTNDSPYSHQFFQ